MGGPYKILNDFYCVPFQGYWIPLMGWAFIIIDWVFMGTHWLSKGGPLKLLIDFSKVLLYKYLLTLMGASMCSVKGLKFLRSQIHGYWSHLNGRPSPPFVSLINSQSITGYFKASKFKSFFKYGENSLKKLKLKSFVLRHWKASKFKKIFNYGEDTPKKLMLKFLSHRYFKAS